MERFKGTAAVICEFNPFHHGHGYLLSEAKKKYGTVFGIMSGNLIQRGGNAALGVGFDYITFTNNMIGVVANGTAVKVEKVE